MGLSSATAKWRTSPLGVGAAWYVQRRRAAVDAAAPGQVYEYYMFLWAIFYASYLCLPFAR